MLFVPETTPDDVAVPELPLTEAVMEWFPVETLDPEPEDPVEDAVENVEVGPELIVAEEDGEVAEESQFRTSKATVPLIVMK